jgi:hypothetical protein
LQKGVVTLYAKVLFDGSGNATVVDSEVLNLTTSPITINPSNGFVGGAVGSPSAGVYGFQLQDPYVRLLGVSMTEVLASGPATVGGVAFVGTTADIQDNQQPFLALQFADWTGAAAAPVSTEILLSASFANSTAL